MRLIRVTVRPIAEILLKTLCGILTIFGPPPYRLTVNINTVSTTRVLAHFPRQG